MPELIRKPIQTIKAADASTSSTPVPRSEASTPTTTVSEKTEVETENKPKVSKILKQILLLLLNCYLFINILEDPEEKPKETPATTDDKPIEIKSEESTVTSPVKMENELSAKIDTPEETTVSKIILQIINCYFFLKYILICLLWS